MSSTGDGWWQQRGAGLGLAATAGSGKVVDVNSGASVLDVEAGCAYNSPTNLVTLAGSGLFVSARDSYQCIYDSEKNVFCFGLCAIWESAGDWGFECYSEVDETKVLSVSASSTTLSIVIG